MSSNTFTVSSEDQGKILEKVRKLLAQAESTNFEAEALTFMEKANKLMEDYAISQAMLSQSRDAADRAKRGKVIVHSVTLQHGNGNVPSLYLLNFVAKANRCECWYTGNPDGSKTGNICGFEADVTFVEMLFTSLCVQMANAVLPETYEKSISTKRAGGQTLNFKLKKVAAGEVKHGGAWRGEFMQAYAERIGERFADARAARETTHTESMALALRDVRQEVRDEMKNTYNIHLNHSRSLVRNTDYGARSAGRSAANNADLSGGNATFKGSTKGLNR